MRVDCAADEFLCLNEGAILQLNSLRLIILNHDALDDTAGNNPAPILGYVFAEEMGNVV